MKQIEKPIKGYAPVTLGFGEIYGGVRHKGIDFGIPEGTPVYAAQAGTVIASGYEVGGYGYYVIVVHEDGTGCVYAHLRKKGAETGACLQQGALVGYSGNTGNSSGPHLHFEYRKKATDIYSVVDPALYFEADRRPDQPHQPHQQG